ncbi:MAG: DUF3540 domain-containing protein [Rhodocyclaceae bacterium]|nr:DUF3540 domain-containing protein [Rhodocyclaceae bacterium]
MNITENARVTEGIIQAIGEVEKQGDAGVVVSTPHGIVKARLAFSCLVQPTCGDIVLLSCRDGESYVLSILERRSDAPVSMRIDKPLHIQVAGDATIEASGEAVVGGGRAAALRAGSVEISGESVEINGERLSLAGRAANWVADSLDVTARMIRQVADTLAVRARSHTRQVEDLELVRVGHMDLRAEQILHMNAEHAMIKSRELVKLDGKQIQVG